MPTVTIHSQRIAQAIINAGQPVIKIEANRKQPSKLVFVFETTDIVTQVLDAVKRN